MLLQDWTIHDAAVAAAQAFEEIVGSRVQLRSADTAGIDAL